MKTTLTQLLFAFLFLGFSMHLSAQDNSDARQKIEKYNKQMADAMTSGDNDKLLSLYSDDVISLPNNGKMIRGIAELRKSNEEMDKAGWKIRSYNPNVVSVETHGNLVQEIGTYTMDVEKEGTGDKRHIEGKYITMWEKMKDGSMKIKTEIWNHDSNQAETAMSEMDATGRDFNRKDDIDDDRSNSGLGKDMDEQNPEGHNMTRDQK